MKLFLLEWFEKLHFLSQFLKECFYVPLKICLGFQLDVWVKDNDLSK